MNITIIGTGYVGLVTGACLAHLGHTVVCSDRDQHKIKRLQNKEPVIHEVGLEALLQSDMDLTFHDDPAHDVAQAEVVFIAVGTPEDQNGRADTSMVFAAIEAIAPHLKAGTVVVNKSTMPVGTARAVEQRLISLRKAADCTVVSNPEFLREGQAVEDFLRPHRIIVGLPEDGGHARGVIEALYAPLTRQGFPLVFTRRQTAELIKYAANGFLAVKLAYINEIADLCEVIGSDIAEVSHGMGLDPRIGAYHLQAGPGYGGSCFPKDTKALEAIAADHGTSLSIISAAIQSNLERCRNLASRAVKAMNLERPGRIAVLGLAFKAGSDDVRESPALELVQGLRQLGFTVCLHDPVALESARKVLGPSQELHWCASPEQALNGADGAVVMTEWSVYKTLDWSALAGTMRCSAILDMRGLLRDLALPPRLHYSRVGA